MEADNEAASKSGKKDLSVFDILQIPVFVVDRNGSIVYGNDAFADLVGKKREQLAGVLATSLIKSETNGVERALDGDSSYSETWATIKSRKYFLEYQPTPTVDAKGNITGAIEAIIDRTGQKQVMQAVHELIGRARAGDLSARARVDAEGDYKLLLDGINEMLDDLINPLKVAEDYIERISKGDIPEQITEEYHGDFNNIKTNLNSCIGEINGVIGEMGDLVRAASEGVLTKRGDTEKFQGAYKEMIQDMNGLVASIADPLGDFTSCLELMAVNDLTRKMSKDYPGIWNELKDATNGVHGHLAHIRATVTHISDGDLSDLDEYKKICRRSENDTLNPAFLKLMESLRGVIGEVEILAGAITAGDLSKRGDEKEYQGAYRDIIHGMNGLIESVANPLNDLIAMLERLAVNDYTQKMVKDYTGVWDELKKAINTTLQTVLNIQDVAVKVSNGDLSKLDDFRKIGRRCENDQLTPTFTKMMEAIEGLIRDTGSLADAAMDGRLSVRADASKHQGEFRKVIEGVNNTLDAMIKPVEGVDAVLKEMGTGNLDVEVTGDLKGVMLWLKIA